jgi:hypothetical protein
VDATSGAHARLSDLFSLLNTDILIHVKNVWRYQRGNQKQSFEEQTING